MTTSVTSGTQVIEEKQKAAPKGREYSIPDVPFLTTTEAAKIAGVTKATVINWCRAYDGLSTRVGYRFRVYPDSLRLLLEGNLEKKQQTDHDRSHNDDSRGAETDNAEEVGGEPSQLDLF